MFSSFLFAWTISSSRKIWRVAPWLYQLKLSDVKDQPANWP